MNLPDTVRTVRWMIRDTFRQSIATKLFYVMITVIAVLTLLCASIRVTGDVAPMAYDWEVPALIPKGEADRLGMDKVQNDGVRVISGEVSFGFGATKVPLGRTREDAVHFIQSGGKEALGTSTRMDRDSPRVLSMWPAASRATII